MAARARLLIGNHAPSGDTGRPAGAFLADARAVAKTDTAPTLTQREASIIRAKGFHIAATKLIGRVQASG